MLLGKKVIFNELQRMHSPLHKSFPYRATAKMQLNLKSEFTEDDCINADFNHYCFEWFPQYRFIETEIVKYPILYRDFMNYEKTRKLLLYYLTE